MGLGSSRNSGTCRAQEEQFTEQKPPSPPAISLQLLPADPSHSLSFVFFHQTQSQKIRRELGIIFFKGNLRSEATKQAEKKVK